MSLNAFYLRLINSEVVLLLFIDILFPIFYIQAIVL
jgi:hypothetical protein